MPADKSSIELGAEIQTRLIGAPATGKYIAFAPAIDKFLKGHLFGDIFGRDNLDYQSREIATISALASMAGVNAYLCWGQKSGYRKQVMHQPFWKES